LSFKEQETRLTLHEHDDDDDDDDDDGSLEPKHVANCVLMNYIYVLTGKITLSKRF
jgi:hypothetical protein